MALVASASTWFYVNRILIAQQVSDAAAHNRPRGNLSDLYPRWLGARELLLHGRNPYSDEVTQEIQRGYYGRPLDPARPDEPKDHQGFAYPVYVVFLLAPTIELPFDVVHTWFRWFLIVLAMTDVALWLRVLRWKPSIALVTILIVLVVGWLPMVQGIKLQQLTLVVASLVAACGACLVAGWFFLAGALLALATIKPQLVWPLVLWLLVWAASDWHRRRRFVFGFGSIMILLLAGAQWILPGWPSLFIHAIGQYRQYTQNQSILSWMFGLLVGRTIAAICVFACTLCVWRLRRESPAKADFGKTIGLVLALTVLIVPMLALYNQVLLAPAIFALAGSILSGEKVLPSIRVARAIGGFLLIWPWIATFVLDPAYIWLTPALRLRFGQLPFYSSLMVPIFIFGLALLDTWPTKPASLPEAARAE